VSKKLGYLAEAISKQSAESAAWLLCLYSKWHKDRIFFSTKEAN
jgi:hypothetical protein